MKTKQQDIVLSAKEEAQRGHIERLRAELAAAMKNCKHHTVKTKHGSAMCLICGTNLGWFCPSKESHGYCEYDSQDFTEDSCIYCREPAERK